MLRILLTKYWVLAHLLVMAGTLCFAPEPSVGFGVWAALSLVLMGLSLPPVRRLEGFASARLRVWGEMRGDVVFWGAVLGLLFVGVGLMNGPRELVYSSELKRWVYLSAGIPFFPSSIELGRGVDFFVGLLCGLAGAVTVRAVLPRSQRLLALLGLVMIGGLLGVGCVVTGKVCGVVPEVAWLGGAFGASVMWFLLFCVGLGIASEAFLEGHLRTLYSALGGAFLNLLGLFGVGAPVVMAAGFVVCVFYVCFSFFAVRASGRFPRVLWQSVLLLPVLFGVGLGLAFVPGGVQLLWAPGRWAAEMGHFFSQWGFRADLALSVFTQDPMLGAGADGFAFLGKFYVKGKQAWALWKTGGVGVPCDFLKLLLERGMLGSLLLLLPGFAMIGKCLMRWVEFRQGVRRHYSLRYIFVFAGAAIGVIGVLLASLIGTPLHTPAILCVFLIVCATLSDWMPRLR